PWLVSLMACRYQASLLKPDGRVNRLGQVRGSIPATASPPDAEGPAALLRERLVDDEVARPVGGPFLQAALDKQAAQVTQHIDAATDHGAVLGRVERWQAEIGLQPAGFEQRGDPALVDVGLARDGRIVGQLRAHLLADELVPGQFV